MAAFQYRDKWLRVIVYPTLAIVIRHFGEMGSLGYLLKTRLYYLDLLWNMLIVACSWEANRAIIIYLDGKYSWSANKFQRFVLQFFIGLPLTFFIVIPMIYLWNEVLTEHHGFDTANLLVNDVPLVIIFTGIMHLVYTGMYHKQLYEAEINRLNNRILELENSVINTAGAQPTTNTGNYREIVVANHGISSVPVHVKDIAYIYKLNELLFLVTFDGLEYTSSTTLEQMENILDPQKFFRLNRQMMVSLAAIKQFKPESAGRLTVELHPKNSTLALVSKKKATEFKEWLNTKR